MAMEKRGAEDIGPQKCGLVPVSTGCWWLLRPVTGRYNGELEIPQIVDCQLEGTAVQSQPYVGRCYLYQIEVGAPLLSSSPSKT